MIITVAKVAKVAVAAVSASLAFQSGRNMVQTHKVMSSPNALEKLPQGVADLEQMKRRELLDLYFGHCESPSLADMEGDWSGVLLKNNGNVRCIHRHRMKYSFTTHVTVDTHLVVHYQSLLWSVSSLERKIIRRRVLVGYQSL